MYDEDIYCPYDDSMEYDDAYDLTDEEIEELEEETENYLEES